MPGIQIPASAQHCPSVWPLGQSLLSSWLNVSAPTETPTSPDCLARRRLVRRARGPRLCFRKDHRPKRPWASAQETFGYLLAAHSPTTAFEARRVTRAAPGTNPAAVAVPALVSIFASRVPWVSWFPSMANTVSRCGRQAVLLDAADWPYRSIVAAVSGYESRRSPYRETVACPQCASAIAAIAQVSASTLAKLTGKRFLAFRG